MDLSDLNTPTIQDQIADNLISTVELIAEESVAIVVPEVVGEENEVILVDFHIVKIRLNQNIRIQLFVKFAWTAKFLMRTRSYSVINAMSPFINCAMG